MPAVATLIDTGPIVASLNARDPNHAACRAAFAKLSPFAYTCWPVITEAVYLLGNYSPAVVTRSLNLQPLALTPEYSTLGSPFFNFGLTPKGLRSKKLVEQCCPRRTQGSAMLHCVVSMSREHLRLNPWGSVGQVVQKRFLSTHWRRKL